MTTTTQPAPVTPESKWEQRKRNDVRAQERHKCRKDIDKRLEELRLERQLQEVVT